MLPLPTEERRAPRESPRTSLFSREHAPHLPMPKASQVAPQPPVDSTESCRFYMIKAEFIRAYSGLKLPFF